MIQGGDEDAGASSMQISDNAATANPLLDAVPVPTQKVAYEQIEHSLQNTPASSPQERFDMSKKMLSPGTSPTSPKVREHSIKFHTFESYKTNLSFYFINMCWGN